jgi:Ca-activated chloride channel family protein
MEQYMRQLHILSFVFVLMLALSACNGVSLSGADNSLTISVVYGSEKQSWMEAMTQAFNDQQVKTANGKTIVVNSTAMGSNDSLRQILDGTLQPTVWSPASGILIPVANEEWASRNNDAQLIDEAPALVLSPVVVAMWEPMARALGWPDKALGWGDIAELAASGKTWADFGHPEWGPFQFGHTHPDYSNSGITGILATAYAAAGKTRDLSVTDVQAPATAEFLRAVESGVIHYGESTGFFAEQMFSRGPSYLSAAVLYENLVVESRTSGQYPNLSLSVVAIYPREGTFWSDHPYAILNGSWVDEESRAAAETFRDFLLAQPQQQQALQYGFRPADPAIPIGAPIELGNGVDPAQPQTVLEVPGADVIQAVQTVWLQNKKRVDVMVVLDISGSMEQEGRLENAKSALRTFVNQLTDDDGFGLTVFNDTATVVSAMSPIGSKRQQVLDQIGGLFPDKGTRMVDTLREVYATLSAEPPGQRIRAIIVLGDGADNESGEGSTAALTSELSSENEGYSIKVFTIAYGTGTDVNLDLMRQIAEASGAKTYESGPTDIEQVYRDIATFF